ncbi:MAG: translation initiation factor IF-2 subunit gamma [Euryarchaeota archaeon]|nr:translation initiation factor IF-2 subunit gamma [Euryarchaeota archaeon]
MQNGGAGHPVVNIGVVGHVDHGKTLLVKALTGVWTDRHSEEVKRGISIRLGYADATFRRCEKCGSPDGLTIAESCPACKGPARAVRTVSFVDSPGHETLMATMLSGAALMDGALLVIAANEKCPQPQTLEHLMALDLIGIRNVVVVQNKVDLVSREEAVKHHRDILEFVKGTMVEGAPVVPLSASYGVNVDALIQTIEERIPTPKAGEGTSPRLPIARSFDVNRPGTLPAKLVGGVVGGSLAQGHLKVGTEVEILPGLKREEGGRARWEPIRTRVVSLMSAGRPVEEVTPGGLIGLGTQLDPSLTKSDGLVGQVLGAQGTLPPVWNKLTMDVRILQRAVGQQKGDKIEPLKPGEPLMLSVSTAITVGSIVATREGHLEVTLKRPVCAEAGARVAISRRSGSRWHLIGAGTIKA